MPAKIYPAAQARIFEIWDYTGQTWDEEQANLYVRGLIESIHQISKERRRWILVRDKIIKNVFFFRYRHHYVFFRELSRGTIGIISVLHENMDIPVRLKEDARRGETE